MTDAADVFDVLGDESSRVVLAELDEARSAQEVAERSGVPLSTVYRALDRLSDAELVDRRIVIRDDGNRVFRFARATDELLFEVADDGLSLAADLTADGATRVAGASD